MITTDFEITKETIAARAYELYINGGCQDGQAEQHWLQAEAELKNACQAPTQAIVKRPTSQIMPTAKKKAAPAGKTQVATQ
jgi:hypothetical protein